MKTFLAVIAAISLLATAVHAQSLTGSWPAGGGLITVTSEGGVVNAAGLDFTSSNNGLVPVPPGDTSAPATPFTFMLANSPGQVTFGNLGTMVAIDGALQLAVGANADAIISASWGDGPTPVAFPVAAAGDPTPDARLCIEQGDPVASAPFNLVDSFCIPPTNPIGDVGGPAAILGSGQYPANDQGQLDVFVIWEPSEVGVLEGQTFQYSSSLSWSSDKPDAVFKEWVGNFNAGPDNPFAVQITNSGDPALTPGEPTFVQTQNSATITDRTFDSSAFPPPVGRYHIQVTGLDPGELVTFSKSAAGGQIVPEPSSMLLGLLGCLSLLRFRKSR